jgi:hypothetical protein
MRFIAFLLLLLLDNTVYGEVVREVRIEYREFRRVVAGSFTQVTAWEEVSKVTLVPVGGNEDSVVLYGVDNDPRQTRKEKIGEILKYHLTRREELLAQYHVLLRAARELGTDLYDPRSLNDLQPDMERLRKEVRLIALAVAGNHAHEEL